MIFERSRGKIHQTAGELVFALTILRFFFEKSSNCFRWLIAKTPRCGLGCFPTPHSEIIMYRKYA